MKRHLKNIFGIKPCPTSQATWVRLFIISSIIVFGYTFFEWLFFATKPSFMTKLSLPNQLEILLISSVFLVIPILSFTFILFTTSLLLQSHTFKAILVYFAAILLSIITAITVLLLFDNFTYTVFGFGIVQSGYYRKGVYLAGFLGVSFISFKEVLRILYYYRKKPLRRTPPLLLLCIFIGLTAYSATKIDWSSFWARNASEAPPSNLPNIILLLGDGLNANHMSLYGYKRNTTPNLLTLTRELLVSENGYSNSPHTTGSTVSLLTGKPVTSTRVIFPPDILRSKDAYEHLPGLLHDLGYHTVQISLPQYADAYMLNLQDGFDIANNRSLDGNQLLHAARKMNLVDTVYFITRIIERSTERLLHILYIQDMPDPYRIVTGHPDPIDDMERIALLKSIINGTTHPYFVHLHLMGTHGPQFNPNHRIYSEGIEQRDSWMVDFYDDSILDFDSYVADIFSTLRASGMLNNTLVIISSDHATQSNILDRIPILIHFPNGEYAGRITRNTQTIDIAPTILDYIGAPIPDWMSGSSLIRGDLSEERLIYSAGVRQTTEYNGWLFYDYAIAKSPFYQFSFFGAVACDQYVRFNTMNLKWQTVELSQETPPCSEENTVSTHEVALQLIDHLRWNGFDVSTIPIP